MPASFLLDSNVLIYVLDERSDVVGLVHQLIELEEAERPAISTMTIFEVLTGADADEQERTLELLAAFDAVPVSENIAGRAAAMAQWQRAKGQKVAVVDTIIAATALALDRTLVTYDQRHFARFGVDLYQDMPALD